MILGKLRGVDGPVDYEYVGCSEFVLFRVKRSINFMKIRQKLKTKTGCQ